MGLLNSNDYNRGYENGYGDAMAGKEKSYIASGFSLKFALHGSKAIESYNEGYDEGYRMGMRDRCRSGK